MGAWIKPVDKDNTEVTVVTKRRITVNVATTLTEGTYHRRFAQAVEIVKKGATAPTQYARITRSNRDFGHVHV